MVRCRQDGPSLVRNATFDNAWRRRVNDAPLNLAQWATPASWKFVSRFRTPALRERKKERKSETRGRDTRLDDSRRRFTRSESNGVINTLIAAFISADCAISGAKIATLLPGWTSERVRLVDRKIYDPRMTEKRILRRKVIEERKCCSLSAIWLWKTHCAQLTNWSAEDTVNRCSSGRTYICAISSHRLADFSNAILIILYT